MLLLVVVVLPTSSTVRISAGRFFGEPTARRRRASSRRPPMFMKSGMPPPPMPQIPCFRPFWRRFCSATVQLPGRSWRRSCPGCCACCSTFITFGFIIAAMISGSFIILHAWRDASREPAVRETTTYRRRDLPRCSVRVRVLHLPPRVSSFHLPFLPCSFFIFFDFATRISWKNFSASFSTFALCSSKSIAKP